MKRVGNRPAQLVRSASRRGKASSRFQFDVTVEKIFGTKPGLGYFVKWSRGVKVATTKPVPATKEATGKTGLAINQKMSLMVTLYREEGKRFDPKDAKFAIVTASPGKKQERTVAKIHFDLSSFAGVPSATASQVFKLSDKFSIRVTIDSRFVKAGGRGAGSGGASSAMSGMTAVSGPSSDDVGDDDFGDLVLDDVPEPEVLSTSSARSKKAPLGGRAPEIVPQSKVALAAESPRLPSTDRRKPPSPSVPGPGSPRLTPSSTSLEKRKPPSPLPPSTESVSRGFSSVTRVKREKSSANGASEEAIASQRAEAEAKMASLQQRTEQLSAELRKTTLESRVVQEAHTTQVEELKAKLAEQKREASSVVSLQAKTAASMSEESVKRKELEGQVLSFKNELADIKKSRDALAAKCKSLAAVEEKNRELSHEVDRLTIAAATVTPDQGSGSGQSAEVEKLVSSLRKENEAQEVRLKAHETHAAKVRSTYEQLSEMYEELREHNSALQTELDEKKANAAKESTLEADSRENQIAELDEARQEVRDIEASKESLQSDYDRLHAQLISLQERFSKTSELLEDSQREVEDLCAERDELKGQRDMAMQRALSRGKSGSGSDNSSKSIGRVEEEFRVEKEKFEREHARMTRRTAELEAEVIYLREDIDYEKGEKLKAREDRDKIRENARELERKTSQAALHTDAMSSLRRELSTHQMREQDHDAMITDLRAEVGRLQSELEHHHSSSNHYAPAVDDLDDVLRDLVSTKLALAESEDEKLHLQFSMKQQKKTEKSIQQKLAAHASRLEVKLGQASEELDRLRKRSPLADASEFNELGSDVDY